ncbi:ArsR family transcriptional regulator [Haloarchaeobius baliensis]|uniref:ArsR family transcriptional regulator n=1 Tax=Haloarchaeobius baliensis TaxID=1670458 RepID=UPI003F8831CF
MTPVDRDILELLKNDGGVHELVLNPRHISENIDWNHQTVREHVLALRNHGLIEHHDESKGIYRLSDLGRAYLAGEVDAEELEE